MDKVVEGHTTEITLKGNSQRKYSKVEIRRRNLLCYNNYVSLRLSFVSMEES